MAGAHFLVTTTIIPTVLARICAVTRRSHRCLMTYIAVTVLAMICAIEVNSWTKLVRAVVSRTGTTTSDPGPGWGLVRTNSQCRRVRTSPLAYRTPTFPRSAWELNPPAP